MNTPLEQNLLNKKLLAKQQFATRLLDWFDLCGRKDLPWQKDSDPYKIWLSEVMLQQTQVSTVIPYFERFLSRFPKIEQLADADQDEVLHLWSGLGYYARGRNLHAAAQQVVRDFDGVFPSDQISLVSLPGVGRSTAGAIRAQAFEQPAPILDGNVKRVLSRLAGIQEWPGSKDVENRLWVLSEQLLPTARLRDYTQATMDLGATLCTRSSPQCSQCPFKDQCVANQLSLQADIPARKPKKQKPVREKIFLVLANESGELLLEKRPQTGIWGGLWSFPESEQQDLEQNLVKHNGHELSTDRTWLKEGRHVFSHFQLNYKPLLIRSTASRGAQINEANQQIWYSDARCRETGLEIGLAAPVIKLLKEIQEHIHG